jgi:hypothetical protein
LHNNQLTPTSIPTLPATSIYIQKQVNLHQINKPVKIHKQANREKQSNLHQQQSALENPPCRIHPPVNIHKELDPTTEVNLRRQNDCVYEQA